MTNRLGTHRPPSSGPASGKVSRAFSERAIRAQVSSGRPRATIISSTSRRACGVTRTCATQVARSSSGVPSPRAAWARPSCVRSHAPGIASRISVIRAASGSASSSAVDRSERASVPSCTCVRAASLASFPACLSSSVTLIRLAIDAMSVHYRTGRVPRRSAWAGRLASCRKGQLKLINRSEVGFQARWQNKRLPTTS